MNIAPDTWSSEVDDLRAQVVRLEAQSETRRQQTFYWKERAEQFEAKMNELDRAYISEHGQRRRAEDEQDRLKNKLARRSETVSRLLEERNNAEARIEHLESTAQVLVREALQAEKARDEHRRGKAEAEARIQAVRDLLDENPAAYARTYNHHVRLALDASPD